MPPRLKTVLAVVGSFVLGGGLLYLALRGVDFAAVGAALAEADWRWLLPLLAATLAAHALRAWRWKLMLETLPGAEGAGGSAPVPFRVAFYSVMIGYMVNYAAPRVGEVARAANVAAQTPLRFPGVLGTVVVERVLDVLTLGVALLSVLALFRTRLTGVLGAFFENAQAALPAVPWAVVAAALAVTAVALALLARVLYRRRLALGGPSAPLGGLVRSFRDGLLSLLRLRRKGAVALATAGIWALYAVMADIPLRMFGLSEAYGLGFLDAWALMNVGAIGMALPSPGGTGSYHYVTVQTLVLLFGVAAAPAATYALFSHAAQLVLYAVAGFACLLLQGTSVRALGARARAARSGPEPGAAPAEA
ncbi:MAG TPA: lysylphosphatidylglycerol synthase transmembrane domain-containing protein [Rubricoccaceae bacterium]|nr:lysylphosphatidylglycerol synthase transmembrane domain-containing protein [Rubricoccaceae bacterium]